MVVGQNPVQTFDIALAQILYGLRIAWFDTELSFVIMFFVPLPGILKFVMGETAFKRTHSSVFVIDGALLEVQRLSPSNLLDEELNTIQLHFLFVG